MADSRIDPRPLDYEPVPVRSRFTYIFFSTEGVQQWQLCGGVSAAGAEEKERAVDRISCSSQSLIGEHKAAEYYHFYCNGLLSCGTMSELGPIYWKGGKETEAGRKERKNYHFSPCDASSLYKNQYAYIVAADIHICTETELSAEQV